MTKAGALEHAARLGIMLVAPDTSPRVPLAGDRDSWDFGIAAGFYLDATQAPWAGHYRMYSYVVDELPRYRRRNFPADVARSGIMGHSMGGHGALTIALKNPQKYRSLSAFAPIAAPIQSPWGQKAFTGYLGAYRAAWSQYDATELVKAGHKFRGRHPHRPGHGRQIPRRPVEARVVSVGLQGRRAGRSSLKMREGYDHGYFFIQSFIRADCISRHRGDRAACYRTFSVSSVAGRPVSSWRSRSFSNWPVRTAGSGSRYLRRIAGR